LVQAFATLSLFGSLGFIAFRCISGVISLGDMVMFFQAFQRGLGYFKELLGSIAGLYEDNLFITNFYEFLDIKPQIKTPAKPCTVPDPMEKGIALEHVSFRYPEGSRNVLEDVSLSIKPGEVVAFVGENGSGKTTLVKLLCRLYDPTGGVITMDGIDLKMFDPNELRRQFGIIFQDFAQYHLTALENIWLGNIELSPDKKLIADAAKYAGADDLIRGFSEGYETMLGKWFENGEELSGGQWQKIALARAFLRDAGLIVLDEPTSSLDPNSEFQLFTKFRQLLKGRSAVLISHRFSTVLMADRIFVLDKGRIIESGSHDQLIQKGGKYSLMFERQAKHYRN
jgi:ATP-binding cassette subfamily B protein